jgi:tetratricopeptide (TPR) repeat protein
MVRSSLTRIIVLAIALGLSLSSAQAQQSTTPTEVAKERFQAGSKFFVAGDYALAIEEFKAARLLVKRPSILFNIAQCYRNLLRPDKAIDYYLQYLKEWGAENPGKEIPHRAEVDAFLKENDALPGQKANVKQPDSATKTKSTAEPAAATKTQAPTPLAAAITKTPQPHPSSTQPIYKKWWLWTIVGAVVVGATTAAVVATQTGSPDYVTGSIPPGIIEIN